MSTGNEGLNRTALSPVLAASGVAVTSDDVAAVAAALERIQAAAAKLLRQELFDDAAEAYFRLLEDGQTGEAFK